jgi:TorA maturation chaperone TorD
LEKSVKNDTSKDTLLTRAGVYQLLARAFYPPEAGIAEKLWSQAISQWNQNETKIVNLVPVELRLEYNRLFVGPNALPCPPYESVYRRDRPEAERGMLMGPSVLDVKRRYSEAGLVINKDFSDLPDHVAVELEFMCFLCTKEESASSDVDADIWKARQEEFCKLHLNPWIGEFTDSVLKSTKSPFYRASALFLKEWIEEEGEAFRK